MQSGTTPSGTVETVPDFRISLDGSAWPPASGELPAGTGSVTDFSIQRDLTGGGLPGAARGGSGFSVASGSVTLPMGRSELTPWAEVGKRVSPGGLAWFRAHPTTLTSLTLGRFIVDECSGASMGGLKLDLVESQRQMDGPFTYPWTYDATIPTPDASNVLAAIAQSAGGSTSWWPNVKAASEADPRTAYRVLAMPFDGSIAAAPSPVPGEVLSHSGVNWASLGGQTFLGPGATVRYLWPNYRAAVEEFPTNSPAPRIEPLSMALVVAGAGVSIGGGGLVNGDSQTTLTYTVDPTRLRVYRGVLGSQTLIADIATPPATSTSPTRAFLLSDYVMHVRLTDMETGLYVDTPMLSYETRFTTIQVATPPGGYVRDVVVNHISGYTNFKRARPTAYIEHTGSPLKGVFDVAGKSARDAFQAIAEATMGAGWQSETGDLIYRNAASLRTGRPVEAVVATEKLEDLPWSISRDNSADRVTVSYTPADVQQDSAHKITLWEATEPIMVPGNRTVTVTAEITGTTDRISPFSIVTTNAADAANATYSRWHASSSREGGGTRPADGAIRIETKITGPSTVKLTITNTTSGTLWLVDGNGNPLVILRTSLQVQPGEPQVLEWGQPEDKALNPFPFDCGQWVQDQATAQAMLAWLVDQLRSPLPTITQVRIIPDLRRQLGDIVTLTDEDSGLKAKALIIGISLEGDAGGYTQRLTLAILSVTYSDVKRWCAANGITNRGQLKSHLVANGATTYAKAREYLARVGVDA